MRRLQFYRVSAAMLLLLTIGARDLRASSPAWGDSGVTICAYPPCLADNIHPDTDGKGGAVFAWFDFREIGDDGDLRVIRLGPSGSRLEPWPADGLLLAGDPNGQYPWGLHSDGLGNVFVLWTDYYPVEQGVDCKLLKVTLDGSPVPGWPVEGLRLSLNPLPQDNPQLISDGAGGAYVLWDDERDYAVSSFSIYMQRVTADGQIAAGWPRDGLPVCRADGDSYPFRIVPDGAGGAIVLWNDFRPSSTANSQNGAIYALRVLPEGTRAPGWNEDGNLLIADRARPAVASDGAGGFFVGSSVVGPNAFVDERFYVHRFTRDGALVPGWPAEGIVFCEAPDFRDLLQATPDEMGGVLFSWSDYRSGVGVYLTRLQPDGSFAPGWPPNGTRVNDPASTRNDFTLSHVPDGRGGAYVLYESGGAVGSPAVVARMGGDGEPAPGWPAYGVRVAVTAHHSSPRIASDGKHGVIASWEELGGTGSRIGAFANLFREDVVVAARISLLSQRRTAEGVDLEWHGAGAGTLPNRVERRSESETWVSLGSARSSKADQLAFSDRIADPATRYAYRLAYVSGTGSEEFTDEVWSEALSIAWALHGFTANPSPGPQPSIDFDLPDAAPARLDLIDARGRILESHEVGALGPGRHRISARSRLSPGVYWSRLQRAAQSLVRKGVVLP